MQPTFWSDSLEYFKACWIDFSPTSLDKFLSKKVKLIYITPEGKLSEIKGKEKVLEIYKTKFFDVVINNSTKIHNFSVISGTNEDIVNFIYTIEQRQHIASVISNNKLTINETHKYNKRGRIQLIKMNIMEMDIV